MNFILKPVSSLNFLFMYAAEGYLLTTRLYQCLQEILPFVKRAQFTTSPWPDQPMLSSVKVAPSTQNRKCTRLGKQSRPTAKAATYTNTIHNKYTQTITTRALCGGFTCYERTSNTIAQNVYVCMHHSYAWLHRIVLRELAQMCVCVG